MHSSTAFGLARSVALGVAAVFCVSAPALTQNWEASHQLRAGAFIQGGHTMFNGSDGITTESATVGSTGFGITAGAEMLRARGWTFGVEGDFGQTGATKHSIVNTNYAADYFGSIRGRLGFYLLDRLVVYGTGGLGFRGVSITDLTGDKTEKTLYGGVYGGGGEWHIGQSTILFAEYLHSDYRNAQIPITQAGFLGSTTTQYQFSGHSDAVRIGAKFKLGFDNYTDDVRDGLRR